MLRSVEEDDVAEGDLAKGGLSQFVAADAPSIHLSGSRRYGPLTPYGRLDVTRMGPGS